MLADDRFLWAIVQTLYFTALAVLFPTVLGVAAAVCFNQRFPLRGLARTIFILPMMATPVAVALVWTMMFHPQLGVLNYLLTSVGLPPSTWVYDSATVIPTLVMVETWQWTPLVMLVVLGGLASLPADPYEAAALDGASAGNASATITLPLVWPFIMVALVLRAVDALKAFDIIFVITGGGPGTPSETLNLYLYQEAFAYYDIGYASAIVVVFFVLILLVTLLLMSQPGAGGPRRERSAGLAAGSGCYVSVVVLVSPALLVFLWMLSLSLKNEADNTAFPPVFIPNPPTLANFADVFAQNDFVEYTINSVIVSFGATGLALLVGVPAGYGIAKAKATGSAALILVARITPGLSYLVPLFLLFQWLGLTGTLLPILITHLVITVPIVVYVMIGFFEGLPDELEEAALVDGATIWQAFRSVALPLARPGIVVATILSFIFSWNNFIFGVVLAGRHTRTLPVAVYNVLTFEQISWGPLAAAALLVTAPVLLLTLLMQKEIVAGLTAGGVKGG